MQHPTPEAHRTRRSRHRRPDERPRVVLSRRDIAILRDVAEQRLLTAELIAWRHFPGRAGMPVEARATVSWAVQRRLQLLWQAGYLRRIFRPVRLGEGQAAIVYALDEPGATVLAQHSDADRDRFSVRRGQHAVEFFIEHTLGVARCWAALATACERTANLRLVDWRGESALKRLGLAERVRVRRAESEREVPVLPDSTGCLVLDGAHRARCFLELDMGTATNAVIADKVRAYAAYLRTAHYAETYGEASCLLLWVTAGTRRAENALRTLAGAARDEPALRGRVLVAALRSSPPGPSSGRSGGSPAAASGGPWSARGCATPRPAVGSRTAARVARGIPDLARRPGPAHRSTPLPRDYGARRGERGSRRCRRTRVAEDPADARCDRWPSREGSLRGAVARMPPGCPVDTGVNPTFYRSSYGLSAMELWSGLTGWWQVNACGDKPLHRHTDFDLYYLENYSFRLDLRILGRTIGAVVRGRGAY